MVSASSAPYPLPEASLREFLETVAISTNAQGIVDSFTFVTAPLNWFPSVQSATISAIASWGSQPVTIYGVEENYLRTAFPGFTIVDSSAVEFPGDLVSALYNLEPPLPATTYPVPVSADV